jgi:type VI secretion system secreted protein Hcp
MATNMYLKFDEPSINGSSDAPGHAGEIEVLSWSHGFAQPTSPTRSSAGSGTVEQATHANLTFTKYLDRATNELLKCSWSGTQIGKATLTCYRGDAPAAYPYLTVAMEHVVVANYSISAGPGDVAVENIALDYGIIKYTYVDQKHGEASTEHNLETRSVK